MDSALATNPYTPGAGYAPPFLAGRDQELDKLNKLLSQDLILKNPIITGLRGVGKTVLLGEVEPMASNLGWVWVSKELSESIFVSEETMAFRLLTDLSFFTSTLQFQKQVTQIGLNGDKKLSIEKLDLTALTNIYKEFPGLISDKLQATFELIWPYIESSGKKGIVFAYDEAQIVTDQKEKDQYPLTLLLAMFQSLQKKKMRYMLLLGGLPSLYPRLVETRTYAERMFTVISLGNLDVDASRKAIEVPLKDKTLKFTEDSVQKIISLSGGYPYFIQFICKESFDYFKLKNQVNPGAVPEVPVDIIMSNLDNDFFSGRWEMVPDRQKEFLLMVSLIEPREEQFGTQEILESVEKNYAAYGIKTFKAGDISQQLSRAQDARILYKVSHGKYAFALPMFSDFVRRKYKVKV